MKSRGPRRAKGPEGQRAPKGREPQRAEGSEGQSALKSIVPKREKFTESPTVLKGLNSDERGRGSRTRRRRTLILTTRSTRLRWQLKRTSTFNVQKRKKVTKFKVDHCAFKKGIFKMSWFVFRYVS